VFPFHIIINTYIVSGSNDGKFQIWELNKPGRTCCVACGKGKFNTQIGNQMGTTKCFHHMSIILDVSGGGNEDSESDEEY